MVQELNVLMHGSWVAVKIRQLNAKTVLVTVAAGLVAMTVAQKYRDRSTGTLMNTTGNACTAYRNIV